MFPWGFILVDLVLKEQLIQSFAVWNAMGIFNFHKNNSVELFELNESFINFFF